MGWSATAAGAILVIGSAVGVARGADKPPNAEAAYAAARIWGYITKVEATLARCRELDSTDAARYDRLYDDFDKQARPILGRVIGIVTEEAIRSGVSPEDGTKRLDPSIAKAAAQQREASNPSRFFADCQHWKAVPVERALKAVDPNDMKLIDDWR